MQLFHSVKKLILKITIELINKMYLLLKKDKIAEGLADGQ